MFGLAALLLPQTAAAATCRFAPQYTLEDITSNPAKFKHDFLVHESNFHAPNVSYNPLNGMTYDGTLLTVDSGLHNFTGLHQFSAPSKEAQQNMLYALALTGNHDALTWVCASDPDSSQDKVAGLLRNKLAAYQQFNESFPGFGSLLPWYANMPNQSTIAPTYDWHNRIPSLDNGCVATVGQTQC